MKEHKAPYYASIDGLRLFAAVNVALYHYVTTMGGLDKMGGSPGWLFTIIKGPMFHASLFFILGGFIFATKLTPHIDSFDPKRFIKIRFTQLYPLHVITTLIMALIIMTSGKELSLWHMIKSIFVHLTFLFPFMPNAVDNLNTPSWALSVFFFAYIFIKPILITVKTLKNVPMILFMMAFSIIILSQWSGIYALMGNAHHKFFFHVFPIVRFFEFLLGTLLAQLFTVLNITPAKKGTPLWKKALIDGAIIGVVMLLFAAVKLQLQSDMAYEFFSYHVISPVLFLLLISLLALQQGAIAWMMALPPIRWLGRGSFYPYLLHIPVAVLAHRIYFRITGDAAFFHYPQTIIGLIISLYVIGALITTIMKRWRKTTVCLLDEA